LEITNTVNSEVNNTNNNTNNENKSWGTYNDTNWESHVWAWSETASGEKFYPVYEDANTKVGFYGDEGNVYHPSLKEGHWEYLNLDRDQLGNVIPTEGDHYNPKPDVFTGEHLYSDLAAQEYD